MRKWLLPLTAIALLLGLLAGARPERASACSCAPLSLSQVLAADAVFAGEVVAGGRDLVEFKVSRVWKGDLDAAESATMTGQGTSCEFDLDKGREYFVLADRRHSNAPLRIGLCTVSSLPYALETLDSDALGPGQPPGTGPVVPPLRESASPRPPATGFGTIPAQRSGPAESHVTALLAAAAVVLVGAGFAATRRRSRRG